ncbi:MAG: hypothetical protein EZS26_001390 [Candidatus Ordinivivax streblomastigis]|uniref:Uncharacterized protein n=1 Tax=Candidatus Ordinivivax streblomastigis TaxID=2540710 RepID=A0A5M8P2F3_9BACT|nr:MAG: hypothetical protein EZS26_001390 [Candidatus Ordinivivax streblomastigis]
MFFSFLILDKITTFILHSININLQKQKKAQSFNGFVCFAV